MEMVANEVKVLAGKIEGLCGRQDRFISAMNDADVVGMYAVFLEEELEHMGSFSDNISDPEIKAYAAMMIAECTAKCRMALDSIREKFNAIDEDQ